MRHGLLAGWMLCASCHVVSGLDDFRLPETGVGGGGQNAGGQNAGGQNAGGKGGGGLGGGNPGGGGEGGGPCTPLPCSHPDMIACYPLDGNANDGSETPEDGIEEGNVTYGPGVHGSAVSLAGDGFIRVPEVPAFAWMRPFTVEVWFLADELPAGPTSRFGILDQTDCIGIFLLGDGTVRVGHFGAPTFTDPVSVGTFHHLVVQATDAGINVFLDGELTTSMAPPNNVCVANEVVIGANDDDTGSFDQEWRGRLDEVRVLQGVYDPAELCAGL